MVNIVLVGVQLGDFEVILGTKLVILIAEDVIVEIVIQQSDDKPPILVVSDSASVVALSSQILERGEGYFIILVDEHLQLAHRNTQI